MTAHLQNRQSEHSVRFRAGQAPVVRINIVAKVGKGSRRCDRDRSRLGARTKTYVCQITDLESWKLVFAHFYFIVCLWLKELQNVMSLSTVLNVYIVKLEVLLRRFLHACLQFAIFVAKETDYIKTTRSDIGLLVNSSTRRMIYAIYPSSKANIASLICRSS